MRDAAVGFQCPDCVAEGAKQSRQGRTTYGGLRPTDATATSIGLIVLNAAVWLAINLTGGSGSRLVDLLALRPDGLCAIGGFYDTRLSADLCARGGTFLPGFVDGAWWQVLTSGFTHVQLLHIAFNMLALWMLGPQLEHLFGRTRFLALYLLSLLAGSVAVLWLSPEYQATLGASGAIYGLFAAFAVCVRKVGGDLRQIGALLAVNLVITFAVPNISWQGHLGGFVGGGIVAALLVYAPRGPRRATYQLLGLAGVLVVLVGAMALRLAL
jgi:membrane associated rhomboid family serine protease